MTMVAETAGVLHLHHVNRMARVSETIATSCNVIYTKLMLNSSNLSALLLFEDTDKNKDQV